jgi:VanZ family protein
MIQNPKIMLRLLFILTAIILLITLYFGLQGKGFHYSNNVTWIKNGPGIHFGTYGIAYSFIEDEAKRKISSADAFSIEIAFKPENFNAARFNLIFSIHDGRDSDQLIIGQYKSSAIVMNGDDYPHKRKIKRIYSDISSKPPKKLLLTITSSSNEGTKLYVDGRLTGTRPDLILKIPDKNMPAIILGNSSHGNSSWNGEIYGLALYADKLSPDVIENHYNAWSKNHVFPLGENEKQFLCFGFKEGRGTETIDIISGIQKLSIPSKFYILKKRFISMPWSDFQDAKNFYLDIIINLLGFIPLGFTLCACLVRSKGILQKKAVLFSLIFCFILSLCIEIAQAWIPSRSSQGLDVILNTFGAWTGTMICKLIFWRKQVASP